MPITDEQLKNLKIGDKVKFTRHNRYFGKIFEIVNIYSFIIIAKIEKYDETDSRGNKHEIPLTVEAPPFYWDIITKKKITLKDMVEQNGKDM